MFFEMFANLLLDIEDLGVGGLLGWGLGACEKGVVNIGWNNHLADIDLGACGNDVLLVDASHRDSVQLEWTSGQQQT